MEMRINLCIDFTAVKVSKWQCKICVNQRGRRGRPMTHKQAKRHEVSSNHSSKVAATLFRHPESEPSEISEMLKEKAK
jgi:hypothetical protein